MCARENSLISMASAARRRIWRFALEDGLAHAGEIAPADPLPDQPVAITITASATAHIDLVAVHYTTDGSEPSSAAARAGTEDVVMAERGEAILDPQTEIPVRPWIATIPGQPDGTLVRYRVEGWSIRGSRRRWHAGATREHPEGAMYTYSVDTRHPPAWFDDGVVYAVVVDRFSAGEGGRAGEDASETLTIGPAGFAGGTLHGLRERLGYLRDLGVTCLWLLPITESATFDGLIPSSFFNVAERYGGNTALRSLIDEAHESGMRVVLSVPLFAIARDHPLARRAQALPTHPIAQWFAPSEPGVPGDLRSLATEQPDVLRYLISVATFWLGDLGIDGLHIPEAETPTLAFWTDFQRAITERFPLALTLGSVAVDATEAERYAGRIDAILDEPLALHLRRVFALREAPLRALLAVLGRRALRPPAGGRATFLDFLDLDRFLSVAGGHRDRLALAATCQMTLEGTPVLFYGTELGLARRHDTPGSLDSQRGHETCLPMPWQSLDGNPLHAHIARLAALRAGHPALRDGRRMMIPTEVLSGPPDAQDDVGAYVRWTDTEYLIVVLNNAEAPVTVRLPIAVASRAIGARVDDSTPFDVHLATGEAPSIHLRGGMVDVTLPPLGAVIFGQG